MKIKRVEVSGFRGFYAPTVIQFGDAFTVLCGRNGTGKSSVFDAIEYALTGHLERFGQESENRETINDYIWWRKTPVRNDRYVRVICETETGTEVTISRNDRNKITGLNVGEFVIGNIAPEHPLSQLVQTSIIRDETITRFSTELSETARCDFVNRGLGVHDISVSIRNADTLLDRAQSTVKSALAEYEKAKENLDGLNTQVAELQSRASRAHEPIDLQKVKSNLTGLVEWTSDDVISIVTAIRRALHYQRSRLDSARDLLMRMRAINERRAELESAAIQERYKQIQLQIQEQSKRAASLRQELSDVQTRVRTEEQGSPIQSSLANLREHGSRLGLEDGRCPLCGSQISEDEFRSHLRLIDEKLKGSAERVAQLVKREADTRQQLDVCEETMAGLSRELASADNTLRSLHNEESELQQRSESLGIKLDVVALSGYISAAEETARKIQDALSDVESSEALARLTSLTRERQTLQEAATLAEDRLRSYERIETRITDSLRILRRLNGDIIRDRLASISPLFVELYSRLKPHKEFLKIRYQIRGDVKHFLSLLVDSDLNPRFTFSAGQKRVLGLAFLLSVFLARSWSRFKAVLLDDPIQHIDDYRALHVVEVLSAINLSGYQVVCAVEDPDLADVLCRRLGNSQREQGMRIDMGYAAGLGTTVRSSEVVGQMPKRVLLSA